MGFDDLAVVGFQQIGTVAMQHAGLAGGAGDGASGDVGVVFTDQDLVRTPQALLTSRDARVGEPAVIAGWGNDVTGSGGSIGNRLVEHPKTRFISFTGSKVVGLRINEIASRTEAGPRSRRALPPGSCTAP